MRGDKLALKAAEELVTTRRTKRVKEGEEEGEGEGEEGEGGISGYEDGNRGRDEEEEGEE